MLHPSFESLRVRLLLLVLLALLPSFGLIVYQGLEQRNMAAAEAKVEAMRLVGLASTSQKELIDSAHRLLFGLSPLIDLNRHDRSDCNALLASILRENPQYVNFGVAGLDGDVICSAVPLSSSGGGVNITDRHYFQQALKTRDFSVGSYQIDRIARTSTINFGYPVFTEAGEVLGVVFAALDLSFVIRAAAQAQLPDGSVLTVRDSSGTILFRYPGYEAWFGRSSAEAPIVRSILSHQGWGTAEAAGVDGIERLYAFASLFGPLDPGVYLSVGIDSKAAFAEAKRRTAYLLIGLGVVALLALAATWFGGSLFIINQVQGLIGVTRKLKAGDFIARCGPPYRKGEFGELAHAFDEMAESLDRRTCELADAEGKYRSLVEQVPAVTYMMALEEPARMLYVSPQIEVVLGFSASEWTRDSMQWLRQIHPDDRDRVLREHSCSRSSSKPFSLEYRLLATDGRVVWVRDEASVFSGESVQPPLLHGIIRDVTERRLSEEALRQSEEAFRRLSRQNQLILESVGEGIFGLDPEGRVTFMNPAAARMIGWGVSEMIGRSHHETVHYTKPDGTPYPRQECPIYTAFRDGKIHRVSEEVFWRKDGTSFPIEYISTPILERDEPTGVVVSFRDITERKRAEEDLRQSEEHFRSLIENGLDIITVLDGDGAIRYVSPSVERVLGYRAEELIGKNISEFIHTEDMPEAAGELYAAVNTHDSLASSEFRFRHEDGSWRTLEGIFKNLLHDPVVTGIVMNARDITESKALKSQLQQAQKMEAIGTLAGGIAHDFNNILGAILASTEMAKEDLPEGSCVARHLDRILKASYRARDLVKQILSFSRQTEQERMPVEIAVIIKEALKLLRASFPSNIEIRQSISITPGASPALVMADPTQIHQIIVNLCTNAAHAMRETGGLLEVSLENIELDSIGAARLQGIAPGGYMKLTVNDTGHGIDPLTLDRIFDPFFTTKAPGEGTGMGLSVVHGIATSCGGAVTVDTEPGKGSTFHVFLPRIERAAMALLREGEARSKSPVPRSRRGEKILFVDDEKPLVTMWEEILGRLGYEVTAKHCSTEALSAFRAAPDLFDLVITDQTMPNLTGMDISRELVAIRPHIPIILCTGNDGTITEDQARAAGIRRLVMKPLGRRELATVIQEVLTECQLISDPDSHKNMQPDS